MNTESWMRGRAYFSDNRQSKAAPQTKMGGDSCNPCVAPGVVAHRRGPAAFKEVIKARSAKVFGLTIPPLVLMRADKVIK